MKKVQILPSCYLVSFRMALVWKEEHVILHWKIGHNFTQRKKIKLNKKKILIMKEFIKESEVYNN
jgi:hypothetical protein